MSDEEVEQLLKIADSFKKLNAKVSLYALLDKAKAEYDAMDFVSGRETLTKALELDPNNPTTLRGLGCIEQFEGNIEKALEYFKQALKYSEHKEIEYTLIGMAYYLEDNLDDSIINFNLAIEANDNYTKAYEGRNQAMLENHLKIVDLQDALKKYF